MELATISGRIQPPKRGSKEIKHLLFADDMLIFCRGNSSSIAALKSMLKDLYLFTGLRMNNDKSKVFLSKRCRNKMTIAGKLGVRQGTLPLKYLGLPLTSIYPKTKHFAPLIDSTRRKVDGWKINLLSFPGRIELIKSVLQNLIYLRQIPMEW